MKKVKPYRPPFNYVQTAIRDLEDTDSWEEIDDAPEPGIIAWVFGALAVGLLGYIVAKIMFGG